MVSIILTQYLFVNTDFVEPLTFAGEGEYNINAVKEIKVTDSFLELDKKTRKCQTKETYSDCSTRNFMNAVLDQCGCLPFTMRLRHKVSSTFRIKT